MERVLGPVACAHCGVRVTWWRSFDAPWKYWLFDSLGDLHRCAKAQGMAA